MFLTKIMWTTILALQELFEREVDLLEGNAIQNHILKNNIDRSKQLIYE